MDSITQKQTLIVPTKEGGRGLMQTEGAYAAEVTKVMEYIESKEDALVEIVRTHNHNTNLTLLQAVRNFNKSFQSETKQIKYIIAQTINLDEKLVDKEQAY
jgi:hypothetical protein